MTPAIVLLQKKTLAFRVHEYDHDPTSESYGLEAAEKLNLSADRVFKTLVVSLDGKSLAVGVVPVSAMLGMKLIARVAGAKKAAMASATDVERATGYVLGGVSPLGQKKRLPIFVDASAQAFPTIFVSGGRRGLEVELSPGDLCSATGARFAPITQ